MKCICVDKSAIQLFRTEKKSELIYNQKNNQMSKRLKLPDQDGDLRNIYQ